MDKIYAKNPFFEMLIKVAAAVVFWGFFIIFMSTLAFTAGSFPCKIYPPVLTVFLFGF